MSNSQMSEHVRYRIAQSMPVIERNREAILRALQLRVTRVGGHDEPFGKGDVAVMLLLALLIDCGSDVAAFGATRDLGRVVAEHQRLGIGGRHYSRFGMTLSAVLREVLGPRVSPQIVSAWCDTYWYVIGQLSPDDDLPVWNGALTVVR